MIYPDFKKCETALIMQILKEHPDYEYNIMDYEYRAYMFPQMWPNTAGGFDNTSKDNVLLLGQAATEQYTLVLKCTVVFKNRIAYDFYGVFFDGEPCYLVSHPKTEFFTDLNNMNMKCKGAARKAY